jgi:hypothetical protein
MIKDKRQKIKERLPEIQRWTDPVGCACINLQDAAIGVFHGRE